jgi:hypothetical protein
MIHSVSCHYNKNKTKKILWFKIENVHRGEFPMRNKPLLIILHIWWLEEFSRVAFDFIMSSPTCHRTHSYVTWHTILHLYLTMNQILKDSISSTSSNHSQSLKQIFVFQLGIFFPLLVYSVLFIFQHPFFKDSLTSSVFSVLSICKNWGSHTIKQLFYWTIYVTHLYLIFSASQR